MDINELFDKATLDAILADAKDNGIDAEDVEKVLSTVPNGGSTVPTRGANPEGELLSLVEADKDEMADQIAQATGVERGKTGTILMLAAPFILKYLLGSGSSSNQGGSLLGGLLGGGQPQTQQSSLLGSLLGGSQTQQSSAGSLLGSLLGGGQTTQNQSASLLGSLLGGGQQTQSYSSNATASLLGSLLGGGQTQQTQGMDMSSLLGSMLGGGQTQQSSSGGGLMDALFGLLGDK